MIRSKPRKMYGHNMGCAFMFLLIVMITQAIFLTPGAYGSRQKLADLDEREVGDEEVVSIWRRSSRDESDRRSGSLAPTQSSTLMPLELDLWDAEEKRGDALGSTEYLHRFRVRLERAKSLEPTSLFHQFRQYLKDALRGMQL